MKTLRLLAILLIAPLFTNAQLINGSFETWAWADSAHTLEYPNSWTYAVPVHKNIDACDGTYSAVLTDSINYGNAVVQEVTWTGNAPSGISFCYKFNHATGDTAYFKAFLEDQGYSGYQSIVSKGFNQDNSTWTNVSLNFATFSPVSGTFKLSVTADCAQPTIGPTGYSYFNIDNINLLYPVGMTDIRKSLNNIDVYPNPCNGQFKLSSINNSEIISVEIFNTLGENIYSITNSMHQNENEINLSNFPKGIYFAKTYDGEKIYAKKIVIQ